MSRLAFLATVLVVLMAMATAPAFAYERKRTVSVGVDAEGVPISIDLNLTDAGRSVSGSGRTGDRAGSPCTYTLASTGSGGLYADQPVDANLYTIQCGSFTDVRWLRTGPNGQPLQPGPAVDPFQLALSVRDRLPVPQGGIEANPTRSLVGLPTWFWYVGYDGRPLSRTTSAFGVSVEVEATPTSYRWDFGDGTTTTSKGLGRAYPARSPITHTYQTARPSVTVSCTFAFGLRWRTGGGPWAPLPPLSRTASATLEVAESQTVISR
jgi:hypothetical protein